MKLFSMVVSLGPAGDAMWVRVSSVLKGLVDNKIDSDLFHYIIKINSSKHRLILSKIRIYESNFFVRKTSVCNAISIYYKFMRDFKANEYDVIYGNTFLGAIVPIMLKIFHKKPVILDVHGLATEEYKYLGLKYSFTMIFCLFLEFFCFKFSDKIICVSKSMIDYLHLEKNIPLNKLFYITNGVDLDFFKPVDDDNIFQLKKDLGIENKFVFGYIGGFQKWQGLSNFMAAAKKINREDVVFMFVGSEKKSNCGNIITIPKISKSKVPLYYSICDVLVLPRPLHISTEVAAPTKFAEYSAIGKPILTTNVGDAAKYVKEYGNGIVAADNSIENLYTCIETFLDLDISILKEMGINSRKLAEEKFNWQVINRQLSTIVTSP